MIVLGGAGIGQPFLHGLPPTGLDYSILGASQYCIRARLYGRRGKGTKLARRPSGPGRWIAPAAKAAGGVTSPSGTTEIVF